MRNVESTPKNLTVLFADISGSTALCRSVELEEWWLMLAGMLELMCESVDRFGGWVASFTGDGVLGVFDTPGSDAHAGRACDAALWLRNSVHRAPGADQGAPAPTPDVHIGINSGEVLTGTIGPRYSRHRTACGYAVALAKRMEGLAAPGGICLSEHTAPLAGAEFALSDLGRFEVKGACSPVGVFELVGRSGACEYDAGSIRQHAGLRGHRLAANWSA